MDDDIDEVLNINQSIESSSKSKNKELLIKTKENKEEKSEQKMEDEIEELNISNEDINKRIYSTFRE